MKAKLLYLLLFTATISFAQSFPPGPDPYSDFYKPIADARSTDARSEAMGLTNVSSWDNINTSFYNPAGLSTIEGIQVSGTYANAYYNYDSASYTYLGVAGKINRYLNFKLSRFTFDANEEVSLFGTDYDTKFTFTTFGFAAEPIKNWHIGTNLKLLETQVVKGDVDRSFIADVGILGHIELGDERHVLKPGASLSNFNAADPAFDVDSKYPIFARIGVSYEYTSSNWMVFDTLPAIAVIAQVDYEDDYTTYYRRSFKSGLELGLAKILYLRAGYYYQTVNEHLCTPSGDIYNPNAFVSAFTYGIGVEAPLHEITKLPIRLKINYARMMEPELINQSIEATNIYASDIFQSLTVRLDWKF